jgi:uncharacterized membrane protein
MRQARQRVKDRRRLEADIKLDQKADRQLTEIKRLHKQLHHDIKLLNKKVGRLAKLLHKS